MKRKVWVSIRIGISEPTMLWLFHLSMRHWKLATSYAKYSVHMWQTFYQQLGSAMSKAENG